MFCSKCGNQGDKAEKFCRKCGTLMEETKLASAKQNLVQSVRTVNGLTKAAKDPDELIGNGLASVFAGDGFFLVAIILSAVESSVSSLLWLFLLIPAFFFFGKGFSNIFQARQIRRRMKQDELAAGPMIGAFKNLASDDLIAPSVTERTTRQLK